MDKIQEKFNFLNDYNPKNGGTFKYLFESNINRISMWIQEKEIAGITGWRTKIENVVPNAGNQQDIENNGKFLATQEKKARNRQLKASLLGLKYGVTAIKGKFWENYGTNNEIEVNEDSFLVVNLNDDPNFYHNIFRLGTYYNQDSILYKEKNTLDAYLVGTNNSEWPGYGNKEKAGNYLQNVESQFMSRIGNRGFAFGDKEGARTDSVPGFQDRKNMRQRNEAILSEMDLFWNYNNSSKNLILNESKPVRECLSLMNKGTDINQNNYKNIL